MNRCLVTIASALFGVLVFAMPLRADDNYVHAFTGFTFPPKVAVFERMKITTFNEDHSDIEVDYDNNPFTVHLSAYVYPAHDPLRQHYEKCKSDVLQVHPDAKLLEEKPITFDKSGVKYDGYSALYSFHAQFNLVGADSQDILSKVIVFRRGDYYVLFRISYVASDKTNIEKQIDDFLQKFAWPPGDGTVSSST